MATPSNESNALIPQSRSPNIDGPAGPESEAGEMASLLAEVRKRGIGPTNFLRVCKPNADIDGQYALDLAMPPLLQSAYDGVLISKQNHNLLLESSKGSVAAEIWVIPDPSGKSKRASMTLLSPTGPVKAKVHCPDGKDGPRPNLDIEICANSGDVSISLPRCFRGEITIRASHDRITFSPSFGACTAPLLDIPEERVYFVRDELCSLGEGGTTTTSGWGRRRRGSSGHDDEEVQGTTDKKDPSGVREEGGGEEESLDALLVHGDHRSVRINWDGEADLSGTGTGTTGSRMMRMRIPIPFNLKLGAWKTVLSDVGRDAVRLITSTRPD